MYRFLTTGTIKILLNAHTLINAHISIWMPKMAVLSVGFEIPGTSNKRPLKKHFEKKNPIFLIAVFFLILMLYYIMHIYFTLVIQINGNA